MPPKAQLPPPIDRPLAKAYLREFSGWSTAYPPGLSDPTSLRIMENVLVNKDGSLRVRPGLRLLTYVDPYHALDAVPVGTHEAFYLNDGRKAYLFAVRSGDVGNIVSFRVLIPDPAGPVVVSLADAGFSVPQGETILNFTGSTTYVKYLQVDNKIFALSNAGEAMRMFDVGTEKTARTLISIETPSWDFHDKLTVIQPDGEWVTGHLLGTRTNQVLDPSFADLAQWNYVDAKATLLPGGGIRLEPGPFRTNLHERPLRSTATPTLDNWLVDSDNGTLSVVGNAIRVTTDCDWIGAGAFARIGGGDADVVPGKSYVAAFDRVSISGSAQAKVWIEFLDTAGTRIGRTGGWELGTGTGAQRITTPAWTAPANAVRVRTLIGLRNLVTVGSHRQMTFNNIVVCKSTEDSSFFSGASGVGYEWLGEADKSASIQTQTDFADLGPTTSARQPVTAGHTYTASVYAKSSPAGIYGNIGIAFFNGDGDLLSNNSPAQTSLDDVAESRLSWTEVAPVGAVKAAPFMQTSDMDPGEHVEFFRLLFEDAAIIQDYFDGDTPDTLEFVNTWSGTPHASVSRQAHYEPVTTLPPSETPGADTLISSEHPNSYNVGMFYCFENEVGESAFSQVRVVRVQRPWAGWLWKTPSGDDTADAQACADQLVGIMPEAVFNAGVAARATNWNLYMMTWSDQTSVPVTAVKIAEVDLVPSDTNVVTYQTHGYARMTPQSTAYEETATIPTETNRFNYSNPSHGGQGIVAADRMVIVKDPAQPAVIKWSSNEQGEYHNFSASRGGGYKTLTSGNLFLTACVKLWQNPQSVDSLTILCAGTDGHSTGYYMAPAAVNSQSESVTIMGFEETTATPGTTSPYGCEVFNNTLFHPLDDQLMKSTAANYNINHKSCTDQIENKWTALADKDQIISSQLDKRLYYIVHNPEGAGLEEGANGNELWVFDAETDASTWSRYLIQGISLRKIEFDDRVYMSVVTPTGIFFLDPDRAVDEVVQADQTIRTRFIPWRFETNTLGANKAHDAWCRLQNLQLTLGSFTGSLKWGIKSWDVHGQPIVREKIMRDLNAPASDGLPWDINDVLSIERDLMEWRFYASNIDDEDGLPQYSEGQISLLQARYMPASVNVGYAYGSIETFEYGRAVSNWDSRTTDNGIPIPVIDTRRP